MLAILELPDKTAHKGLSCFSSNKVASKQHQRRHQWRPPSRRLARTRDQLLAIDGLRPTTARPPPAGAGVHRLSACARTSPPARSNWRYGEYTLYRSTDYTDYTLHVSSTPRVHANRSSHGFHGSTDPTESGCIAPVRQRRATHHPTRS